MPDVDVLLRRPARIFYEEIATLSEQRKLDVIIRGLCENPAVDGETKFPLTVPRHPEFSGFIYYDDWGWVVYRPLNAWTLSILNIGFKEELPSLTRR